MSRWWRAYDDAVDNPKLQRLSGELFKAWFNLCCLTSANDGILPSVEVIAFKLRMKPAKVEALLSAMRAATLFDDNAPHNWNARQFKSDVSTERVKRFRTGKRNVSSAVSETPPETDTEADTESKKEDAADAAPTSDSAFVFESGVIRLKQRDFDQWKQAYSHLDLAAELLSLTEWAGQQPKWFFAVSSALAKRNRELQLRLEQQKGNGHGTYRQNRGGPSAITAAIDGHIERFEREANDGCEVREAPPRLLSSGRRE